MSRMMRNLSLFLAVGLLASCAVLAQNGDEPAKPDAAAAAATAANNGEAGDGKVEAEAEAGAGAESGSKADGGANDEASEQASEQAAGAGGKPEKPMSEAEKRQKQINEEKALLAAEYQLQIQKQTNELAKLEMEKKEIEARLALQTAKHQQELAAMKRQIEAISTKAQFEAAKRSEAVADVKAEAEELAAKNALLAAQIQQAKQEVALAKAQQESKLNELTAKLAVVEAKRSINTKVDKDIVYRQNPMVNGTLEITDRRIALNGPITTRTADYITERLHFFNNKSNEHPIFIVIDSSPGGSVMAGYRIVEAMEASEAPVHVVVKSFAASMAAVITTLAEHSYAYPNAILLHHQMSSGMRGNLTQQKEALENAQEWARRLMEPVCEKIEMTQDEFVKAMYENNSDGDWEEFATEAAKLKWVDRVVSNVRERGVVEYPTTSNSAGVIFFQAEEQRDSEGRPYMKLPRLGPFDHWFMYDPQNYYR